MIFIAKLNEKLMEFKENNNYNINDVGNIFDVSNGFLIFNITNTITFLNAKGTDPLDIVFPLFKMLMKVNHNIDFDENTHSSNTSHSSDNISTISEKEEKEND